MTNQLELITTIRNSLAPRYEFPYYALVRIHTRHYGTVHIPAPFFDGSEYNPRSQWAGNLPISQDRRNGEYYKCPFCGEPSYYAGVCQDCEEAEGHYEYEYDEDGREEEYWIQELPLEYRNHEALKASVKEEILYRIDHRIPDLGIISAEIVLADNPTNVCVENESPFFKHSSWDGRNALDLLQLKIEEGIDYESPEIIAVEGSDELRRQVNGIWQHKHTDSGYYYWHPMGRVHKIRG